jgi:small subunit ribosomal protein S20
MAAMPITVGAIRKQRADKRKASVNSRTREALKEAVALMRKKPTATNLVKAFSTADRAAKKGVIHKNKAARLKSRLSSLVKKK